MQLRMIPLAVGAGQWLGAGISSHLSAGGNGMVLFVGASLLANGASRDFGTKTESTLSLTLSLKGEGTVGQSWVF
ncbi:hypothetical protein DK254_23265 [Pseudomonas sp. RW407]|nr:hypothetical protein DK254_23265 [Pseudomonas sp. RW407]